MNDNRLLWTALAALFGFMLWQSTAQGPKIEPAQTQINVGKLEPVGAELEQRIATLEDELTREILLRQALERRLNQLEEGRLSIGQKPSANSAPSLAQDSRPTSAESDNVVEQPSQGGSLSLEDRLLATGLPSDTVQSITRRVERDQLNLLELRNRAIREGWDNTPEYVEKVHELQNGQNGLRKEFGDDIYDQYLYANGTPNRIQVRDVFAGSAADLAGIRPGDVIISYANERMFSMSELRQATTEGNAGESILVEVSRNGLPLSLSIPRGAMGISMAPSRIQPGR
jgi:C-terminal processing protease CtpA/Prc